MGLMQALALGSAELTIKMYSYPSSSSFFFLIIVFISGCVGSLLLRGLFSSCGAQDSHSGGFSCCGVQALAPGFSSCSFQTLEYLLSSCGTEG